MARPPKVDIDLLEKIIKKHEADAEQARKVFDENTALEVKIQAETKALLVIFYAGVIHEKLKEIRNGNTT